MGDWIGLGVIILVVAGAIWGLSHLGKEPAPLSNEEFERRAAEARGTMSASVAGLMYSLQKLMNPKAAEAVEVMKDLRAGLYDASDQHGGGAPDGNDEPGNVDETPARKSDSELNVETDEEEGDDA